MPLTHQIEFDGKLLRVTGSGVVTFAEILETRSALLADSVTANVVRVLVDLTHVDQFALETADLRCLASNHISLPFARAGSRLAFLVSSPVAYGLARMYELSRWNAPDRIEVFNDAAAAMRWLQEPTTPPLASGEAPL
jgi:hypothetical protein